MKIKEHKHSKTQKTKTQKNMKYVITGAAGHISKPLATQLLHAGHDVTVIGRSAENLEPLTSLGAKAAVGSVEDPAFLEKAFAGADAVYTMVPPNWTATDWKGHIGQVGHHFATAIRASGVPKVVNLSSIGAHMQDGCGPVSGIYRVEQAFNALEGTDVLHLRPGYFFYNFLSNIGLIKNMGIMGGNYGADKITLVHPRDIAAAAFEALTALDFNGKSVRYVIGDERTGAEVASVLGNAIGKPELPWVIFEDEQSFQGGVQAGLPEEHSRLYAEMGHALRTGTMVADFRKEDNGKRYPTKLEDFAPEFAAAYKA